jgi:hypothetical protein
LSILKWVYEVFLKRNLFIEREGKHSKVTDNEYKIDFLFEVIKRYDTYIVSTNAKASLIIAFNSIILGIVLLHFSDIIKFYPEPNYTYIAAKILVAIVLLSLISLLFMFNVVYPFFGSGADENEQKDSLVFYGSVSKMDTQRYTDQIRKVSQEDLLADLSIQANILAKGLHGKMKSMRWSTRASSLVLVLIICLVLMKIVCIG